MKICIYLGLFAIHINEFCLFASHFKKVMIILKAYRVFLVSSDFDVVYSALF